MARKRMFDSEIINRDDFLELSLEAKAIYFLLGIFADDEGFISPKKILKLYGGNDSMLDELIKSEFIIQFESGVVLITDWNINNYLNQKRIRETIYTLEKQQIKYVEQLSNRIDDDFDGKYDVTYFGGEPLIEYQNILKFDEYLKQSLNIQHSFVQTNGILLDKEKIRQLRKRNIYIGISCDGYNDKNHIYIEKIFQNKWLPVEAKMMINKYNVSDLMKNVVYFYRQAMRVDCGNLYIDVSFVKDNTWDKQSIEILKQQLKNLYDYTWVMEVMNQTDGMPYFNTPASFIAYLKAAGVERLPSEDSINKKQNTFTGSFPDWMFTDCDAMEAKRRINVGKRFLNIFKSA